MSKLTSKIKDSLKMKEYVIHQNRDSLGICRISTELKAKLLSDHDDEYYTLLAIISKIFEDESNSDILDIYLFISIVNNKLNVNKMAVSQLRTINDASLFTSNGISYGYTQ